MRYLGIDYGTKRVGVAFSDENATLAFPETVLQNDSGLLRKVQDIARKNNVTTVVLGASHDYSGTENPIMKDILRFKGKLEEELRVDVRTHSEMMTSVEARRPPEGGGGLPSRKPSREREVDASAAAIMLQSFLDTHVSGT